MILQTEPGVAHGLNAANLALHCLSGYGVHVRDLETSHWCVYANFEFYGEAEACLNQLLTRGIEARLEGQRTSHSRG